jgi:hypothetical protein
MTRVELTRIRRKPVPLAALEAAPAKPRIRPIFVLGIDRSGTSLLAQIVSHWGAHAGDPALLGAADEGNPQGYWEYRPMQELVNELLLGAGVSAWEPGFKEQVRQCAFDPRYRDKALALISEMQAADRPWFWKEPNFAFTVPFWRELVADPVCLVTLRNPYHSAKSYEKLILPPVLKGRVQLVAYFFLRWQYFMTAVVEELKTVRSKIFIPYEVLLSSPAEQCARICRFLDAELAGPEGDGDGRVDHMAQVVNPDLWRNTSGAAFSDIPESSAEQRALYSYLSSRLDGDVGDFDPSQYPLPPCWREYVLNIGLIRRLLESLE